MSANEPVEPAADSTPADATQNDQVTPAAEQAASEPAWHGLSDPADVAYIGNKGWNNATDVINSYRGAEKLIGRDPSTLIQMPRSDDPEGFRAVMSKLGMPAEAKDYKLDVPEGLPIDQGYQDFMREALHKSGVTSGQAEQLNQLHNEWLAKNIEQTQQDYKNNVASDQQSLQKEWGAGYDKMINSAQQAASSLGFTPEAIDALESGIGYGATMKLFAEMGQKMSEDGFMSSDVNSFDGKVTPDQAKSQWEQLKLDKDYTAALLDSSHPGHKGAVEKKDQLFKLMFPE